MDCLLQDCLESQLRTGEMVQWVRVLTAKSNDLSPVLVSAWWKERTLSQVAL